MFISLCWYLSIYLSVYLLIHHLFYSSIYFSNCLSVNLFLCVSLVSLYLSFLFFSYISISVYLLLLVVCFNLLSFSYLSLSVYSHLSIHLSVCMYVCMYVCLLCRVVSMFISINCNMFIPTIYLGYFTSITLLIYLSIHRSIYIFMNTYLPKPSARAGYDTRSIFKWSLTGLNPEFSFS